MSTLISKASLLLVPSVYEDGTLYNVLPSGNKAPDETGNHNGYDQTRADFTFSRGSNLAATRVNANGLIEKGRENLITYSNDFNQWNKQNVVVTSNAISNPFNIGTTQTITEQVGTSTQYRVYSVSYTASSGTMYTHSVYVKRLTGTRDFAIIDVNVGARVYFDMTNIAVGTELIGKGKIEDVGNGWYRLSVYGLATGSSGFYLALCDGSTGGSETYNADGSGSYALYGAQLEVGTIATAYMDSGATTAQAGILEDMPRINYDANGENGALLLEPSRTNLVTQSEYGGAWLTSSASVSVNAVTSPEGVQNANTITITANSGSAYIENVAVTASTSYTFSFYVKQGTNTENYLAVRDQSNSTFISTDVSYTASATEWKRVDYTFTTPSGCTSVRLYPQRYSTGGQGTTHIWGAQLEAASYASSYIPTHGAAVTRGADSCYANDVSHAIGQGEGTIYIETIPADDSTSYTERIIQFESAGSDFMTIQRFSNSSITFYGTDGTNTWTIQGTNVFTGGEVTKIAAAYKVNDVALYANGTQLSTDTSVATMPNCDRMWFANNAGGSLLYIGSHYKVILFNERLTNEQLATLTTL